MELKATATIGEVIGWNIRVRRAARWTQPSFGKLIGTVLPKPWPAQTVSSAEKGERAFAAAELVAIAKLLEVPVATLFSPPLPVQSVSVTDGLTVPAQMLHSTSAAAHDESEDVIGTVYKEAWSVLGRIAKLRQNIVEQAQLIEQESQSLFNTLDEIKDGVSNQDTAHSQNATKEFHAQVSKANALAADIQQRLSGGAPDSDAAQQVSSSEGTSYA